MSVIRDPVLASYTAMGTMLTCENLRAWMEPLAHKLSEGELARAGCYQRGIRAAKKVKEPTMAN